MTDQTSLFVKSSTGHGTSGQVCRLIVGRGRKPSAAGSTDSARARLAAIELRVASIEETQLMRCAIVWYLDRVATAETGVAVTFPTTVIEERVQSFPTEVCQGIGGNIFPDLFD